MKALSLDAGVARLVDSPEPEPGPNEVLLRVEASAICGSEMQAPLGSNPGHEAAGVLEHVPAGAALAVGERVGVSAVTGCGVCSSCLNGIALHCANGFRVQTGMHAEYLTAPLSAIRKLPADTPPEVAVLLSGDGLGVPVRALRRTPSGESTHVLVIGLGPIGLAHTLVRSHAGAHVSAIEPSEYRRLLGRKLGAGVVVAPGVVLDDPQPDLVIECTGLPSCIQFAFSSVRAGGTVLQSGECPGVELDPSSMIIRREVTYTGAWYYADEDYPDMVQLVESGLDIASLITHTFPASEVADAYRQFCAKCTGKVIIRWT